MNPLEETLIHIAQFLKAKKIPYMVIGGVANLFWGISRTTLDVDVTIQIKEKNYKDLVRNLRKAGFLLRVNDPAAFLKEKKVLPLQDPKGRGIDLIVAKLPYEEQAIRRAKNQKVGKVIVRVCSPEDLIIHKIISDRIRDREDVRGIIQQRGKTLNRKFLDRTVKELSEIFANSQMLIFYEECFR